MHDALCDGFPDMEQKGLSAREATGQAMKELTGALVATSLVLTAVFVPVSFLPGITGMLYRQFAITIAVSVLISTVVALTLSPAMCALLLRPNKGRKPLLFRKINAWLHIGNHRYVRVIRWAVDHERRVLAGFGMMVVLIFVLNRLVPTSFLPEEDQGYFKVELALPEGASLERTRAVTELCLRNRYVQLSVPYGGENRKDGELALATHVVAMVEHVAHAERVVERDRREERDRGGKKVIAAQALYQKDEQKPINGKRDNAHSGELGELLRRGLVEHGAHGVPPFGVTRCGANTMGRLDRQEWHPRVTANYTVNVTRMGR